MEAAVRALVLNKHWNPNIKNVFSNYIIFNNNLPFNNNELVVADTLRWNFSSLTNWRGFETFFAYKR